MRKFFILFASLMVLSVSSLFADDWVVPVSALPQNARAFIQRTFPGAQIWKVERDGRKFDVQLSNGVSIDFLSNGDWVNIDSEYTPIPDSAFPAPVIQAVKNAYMMEIVVSGNGQLMGQKFDD